MASGCICAVFFGHLGATQDGLHYNWRPTVFNFYLKYSNCVGFSLLRKSYPRISVSCILILSLAHNEISYEAVKA